MAINGIPGTPKKNQQLKLRLSSRDKADLIKKGTQLRLKDDPIRPVKPKRKRELDSIDALTLRNLTRTSFNNIETPKKPVKKPLKRALSPEDKGNLTLALFKRKTYENSIQIEAKRFKSNDGIAITAN
ncbi:MAG: hypothetical protein VW397_00905 [Candidatus Margulisiibacteriota bacterium]